MNKDKMAAMPINGKKLKILLSETPEPKTLCIATDS